MVTFGNYSYWGEHCVTYIIAKSRPYTPETNITVCVNYTSNKNRDGVTGTGLSFLL